LKTQIIAKPVKASLTHNQRVGSWGEDIAANYLKNLGYEVLVRNYHTRFGELDIVAKHEEQIVFVEVKTRSNTATGFPEDGMTPKKVQHLLEAANEYLDQLNGSSVDWKIEVVAIVGKPGNYQIELFDAISYGN